MFFSWPIKSIYSLAHTACLTCHYIAEDFTQQQVCLHAAPFNDHHTGEHIGAMINKCL